MPRSTTRSGRVYSRASRHIQTPYSRRAPWGPTAQDNRNEDNETVVATGDAGAANVDTDAGAHNAGSKVSMNGVMPGVGAPDQDEITHLEQEQERHDMHNADLDAFANEVLAGLAESDELEIVQPEQEQEEGDQNHEAPAAAYTSHADPAQDEESSDQEAILGEDTPEGSEAAEYQARVEVHEQAAARVALWMEERRLAEAGQRSERAE